MSEREGICEDDDSIDVGRVQTERGISKEWMTEDLNGRVKGTRFWGGRGGVVGSVLVQ